MSLFTPLAHFLLSHLYSQINAESRGPRDPWSSVMALMPDPDIAGHQGIKIPKQMGGFTGKGVAAASTT